MCLPQVFGTQVRHFAAERGTRNTSRALLGREMLSSHDLPAHIEAGGEIRIEKMP